MTKNGATAAPAPHGTSTQEAAPQPRPRPARLPWLPLLLVALVAGGAGAFGMQRFQAATAPKTPAVQVSTLTRNEQVVSSITREEQVVLLSLGVQGIATREAKSQLFGKDVPGSDRAVYLQYSYRAKLGLDGKQVRVTQHGDKAFTLSLPEFLFIGHDGEQFETVVEKNGVLSGVTPEIDRVQLINELLNDETKRENVSANRELLEEQARAYYSGIIRGLDPEISLDFEFRRS